MTVGIEQMKEILDFLNSIEGAGYGGMASFEIARQYARDMVHGAAQAVPAPVAWRLTDGEGDYEYLTDEPSDQSRAWSRRYGREWEPLYASPVSSPPSEAAKAATKAAAYLRDEVRDDDSINTEVCDKGDPGAYPVYRSAAQTEPEPLRDALEFYADPTRYNGPNSRLEGVPDKYQPEGLYYRIDVTRDGGRIARRALAASSTHRGDGS